MSFLLNKLIKIKRKKKFKGIFFLLFFYFLFNVLMCKLMAPVRDINTTQLRTVITVCPGHSFVTSLLPPHSQQSSLSLFFHIIL